MPVVRLTDSLVERLVLDVGESPRVEGSWRDHRRVSASYELAEKVVRLLAVLDAGEGTVLPLEEDAGMHQDVDQKPRLPLGKPKLRDRFDPLVADAVAEVSRVQGGHKKSSATRG